jgi:toxin CcdB
MSQYHVYENMNEKSKKLYPYLVDVQSTLLSDIKTRMVIPLMHKDKIGKGIIRNLNPIITIKKKDYVLLTQQMAGIPKSQLGSSVCDCLVERHDILSAIDFLITGI